MFPTRIILKIAKLSVVLLTLCFIGHKVLFKYKIRSLDILHFFKLNDFSNLQLKSESSNYVIKPEVGCENVELVLCVLSRRSNYITRHTIRKTWGSYAREPGNNATLIFFLGSEHPSTNISDSVQPLVDHEAKIFGDILQEDYIDSYYNLTLKSISVIRWVSLYCANSKFLLKSDDDMYINVPLLHQTLQTISGSKFIVGYVVHNGRPDRLNTSKWFVSTSEYNKTLYPTYITGPAYAMTTQAAKLLYDASSKISYFFLEDVFITGMCADVADVPRVDDARFLSHKRQPSGCLFRTNIAENVVDVKIFRLDYTSSSYIFPQWLMTDD
ncbi:Beta-1,3-galactosyltransferase 5 [Bulinus truncatus]|nr:Beta-1,3-galactosyltransferase 5 [Bulinus truncatus]